jgi:hypothetical protein
VLAVLAVAALVRASALRSQPLWVDEAFSLAMATGHSLEHPAAGADPSLGDFVEPDGAVDPSRFAAYLRHDPTPAGPARVVRAVRLSDTNPPLYYLLLAAWTRAAGTGDRALRAFTALASLAALALLAPLARRASGRRSVLPAVLLFALSPLAVHYSSEGRMYGLVWLWVAGLLLLAVRARRRGFPPSVLAAYAVAGAGGLLTHYFFAPLWLAVTAGLVAWPGRARRAAVLTAAALSAALAAPWYALVPESLARWRVTGDWLHMPAGDHGPALVPFTVLWNLLSVRAAWGVPLAADVANGLALLAAVLLGWRRLGSRFFSRPRRLLWLALAAGLATPVLADAAMGTHGSAHPRYAIAALPPLLALVGTAFGSLRPRARAALGAVLLAASLAGVLRVARADARNAEPYRQAAAFLVHEAKPADVVLVHSIPSGVCALARYVEPYCGWGGCPQMASWVARLGRRRVPEDVARLAEGRARVAHVKAHTLGDPTPEEAWLRQNGRVTSSFWAQSIGMVVVEVRSASPPSPGP